MVHYVKFTSVCVIIMACAVSQARAQSSSSDPQQFTKIERGNYLATVGDCISCHTAPGDAPYAGGLEMSTPFGTLLSANITSDRETGIGKMTEEEFKKSLREGRGQHDKRLFPAMPYPSYTLVTDEDISALYAYFKTIPPIQKNIESNQLSFPFSLRANMSVWDLLEFTKGPYEPDSSKSEEWNRGAYLVNGLGHCNTCHTSKNLIFGDKSGGDYMGALVDGWFAPNITNSEKYGLGDWSSEDIVAYLKTGMNDRALASAAMAQVVVNSTSKMTDEDLKAMAVYLKSLPPAEEKTVEALPSDDPAMMAGMAIYKDTCAACHKDTGKGSSGLFPELAGSSNVRSSDATTTIRKIITGSRAVATGAAPTGPAMPSFGWRLNDQQIADVVTYIRNSWGNSATPISAGTVASIRAKEAN